MFLETESDLWLPAGNIIGTPVIELQGNEFCQGNLETDLFLVKPADEGTAGQHLDFSLVRSCAEGPHKACWPSDLQKL